MAKRAQRDHEGFIEAAVRSGSEQEKNFAALIYHEGEDAIEQTVLYADWLYALRLQREGDWDELANLAEGWKALRPGSSAWDKFDESTTLKKQTLKNVLAMTSLHVRSAGVESADEALDLLSEYLRSERYFLPEYVSSSYAPNPESGIAAAVRRTMDMKTANARAPVTRNAVETAFEDRGRLVFATSAGGDTSYVSVADGSVKKLSLQQYHDMLDRKIKADLGSSGDGMTLFSTRTAAGKPAFRTADRAVEFEPEVVANMRKGIQPPPGHEIHDALAKIPEDRPFVLYSDPQMVASSARVAESREVAYALQRAFPARKFFMDPLTPETEERARYLANFVAKNADELMAVVAPKSFGVYDGNIVKNLIGDLEEAGIRVVKFEGRTIAKAAPGAARGVIVLTGHTSKELSRFVEVLGKAGYFKDQLVIFNSCGSELTDAVVASMNGKFGARGVVSYDGKIAIDRVEDMLFDLAQRVRKGGVHLVDEVKRLWRRYDLDAVWVISHVTSYCGARRVA